MGEDDECDTVGMLGGAGAENEWRFEGGSNGGSAISLSIFEDPIEAAIGGVISAAAPTLTHFVAEAEPSRWRGKLCVELGSGCGMVSAALAQRGAHVIATEQLAFLEHLEYNVRANVPEGADVSFVACTWGESASIEEVQRAMNGRALDCVLCANCLYDLDAVDPFLQTLEDLCTESTEIYFCGMSKPGPSNSSIEKLSVLDAFLLRVPQKFDSYLISVDHLDPFRSIKKTVEGSESNGSAKPEHEAKSNDYASSLCLQSGHTIDELANGVWLLRVPGAELPSWLPSSGPLFKLPR